MAKRDGTLFSCALFGYKKSDVNAYIKRFDISYDDQLSLLRSENERLSERAQKAEARAEELEKLLKAEQEAKVRSIENNGEKKELKSPAKPKPAAANSATNGTHPNAKAATSRSSSKKRGGIFGNGKRK